jgi:hypothetical protein
MHDQIEVSGSFYNELLQNQTELRVLLQAISDEYNLLDGVCMLSRCGHKHCMWRRRIHEMVETQLAK